jgi:aminopeptidase N
MEPAMKKLLVLSILLASGCTASEPSVVEPPVPLPVASPGAKRGAPGIGDSLIPEQGNGGYDVQSYDLALELETADGPIRGVTTIEALANDALASFNLDFHGLTIESIEVDGRAATFERAADELTVMPAAPLQIGARFRTVVRYSGQPEGVKDPSMPIEKIGWFNRKGETYVFSQPSGAMTFFPCNNHPLDKALFTLRIGVPQPLEAVANGVLVETIDQGERRTFVWRARDPMAT